MKLIIYKKYLIYIGCTRNIKQHYSLKIAVNSYFVHKRVKALSISHIILMCTVYPFPPL